MGSIPTLGTIVMKEDIINGEILFALEIEPVQLGEYTGAMPIHCTVLQWARVSGVSVTELLEKVREAVSNMQPVTLKVEDMANFGENNDVPVDLVRKTPELQNLHNQLKGIMEKFDATLRNPEWAGENYAPHITRVDTGDYKIYRGQEITTTNLLLVTKIDGIKKIVARVALGTN